MQPPSPFHEDTPVSSQLLESSKERHRLAKAALRV
jgi:hypothetical protein